VLIYTSCRKKQDSKKQKESKENQGFSRDEVLLRRTKSRSSGRENSEAQKCAAKTNFNSKKEKQAKRVLTWTELKLSVMTDFMYWTSSLL